MSKKPSTRAALGKAVATEKPSQFERFKAMADVLGADKAPGALDRAFSRLDPKKLSAKPKRDAK